MFRRSWQRRLASILGKTPGQALETEAKTVIAEVTKNPQKVLSTIPFLLNFIRTGERFYLGKICSGLYLYIYKKVIELLPKIPCKKVRK